MMTHDALHELMRTRRSVRRFRPECPDRALIETILASAITAPSASNKQPWRFLILRNRDTIDRMAAAVRDAVNRIAMTIEREFEESFRAYGDYFTRFEHAPLVIVALCRPLTVLSNLTGNRVSSADLERIQRMERDSGLAGTCMALQNLLLAAHAAGLGASGMTGPLVAADRLSEILAIPPSWRIAALVPVGYADEDPAPTARKPLERVTHWID